MAFPDDGPVTGWVLCDEITAMYRDEAVAEVNARSAAVMTAVESGLQVALGMAQLTPVRALSTKKTPSAHIAPNTHRR
ncbi:hypothetical protein IV498_02100 [Paenarthrobacter sp. Z7-10]|nr:hypothetical protein [Paenarthrobacter sp. Z7-10]